MPTSRSRSSASKPKASASRRKASASRPKASASKPRRRRGSPVPKLEALWREQPELISDFLSKRPHYEQLAAEAQYILRTRLQQARIEFSAVTARAKTLKSFLEKITRKSVADPLKDITDLAGVRVVCLYRSELDAIETIVRDEFDVVEKVDKLVGQGADRFGYGAIHYVARLGKKSSGARYDDLKGLLCEIQTRTVLQDAWAIIDHHLIYKKEADIPTPLRRKMNSLVGLFETADDQFDQIRKERDRYLGELREEQRGEELLSREVNLDSVHVYFAARFAGLSFDARSISIMLDFTVKSLRTIGDLDKVITRALPAMEADIENGTSGPYDDATDFLEMAIGFVDPGIRQGQVPFAGWTEGAREAWERYDYLVIPEEA